MDIDIDMDWLMLICGITLIIIGVVALYVFVFPPCIDGYIFPNRTPRVDVSDVIREAQTGDLILFGGRSHCENLIKCVTRSPYSHVAMVVVENGVPFLWESDIGQRTKSGPRVIKLQDKLSLYKGEKKGAWLKFRDESRRPSREEIISLVRKYVDM